MVSAKNDIPETRIAVPGAIDKIESQLVGQDPLNTFRKAIGQDLLGQLVDHLRMRQQLLVSRFIKAARYLIINYENHNGQSKSNDLLKNQWDTKLI